MIELTDRPNLMLVISFLRAPSFSGAPTYSMCDEKNMLQWSEALVLSTKTLVSENDVLIILFAKYIIRSLSLVFFVALSSLVGCSFLIGSCGISFLLSGNLFQTIEFFSVHLVQLAIDVFDRVFRPRYDDVLAIAILASSSSNTSFLY